VIPGADTRRWQPGPLFRLLLDSDVAVQKEAAYGIAKRLADPLSVRRSRPQRSRN
jgi:hypothetical protein